MVTWRISFVCLMHVNSLKKTKKLTFYKMPFHSKLEWASDVCDPTQCTHNHAIKSVQSHTDFIFFSKLFNSSRFCNMMSMNLWFAPVGSTSNSVHKGSHMECLDQVWLNRSRNKSTQPPNVDLHKCRIIDVDRALHYLKAFCHLSEKQY